jgi:hypothetical protein
LKKVVYASKKSPGNTKPIQEQHCPGFAPKIPWCKEKGLTPNRRRSLCSKECGKQDLNLHWFNPTRPSTYEHPVESGNQQGLTSSPASVCTSVCTSDENSEKDNSCAKSQANTSPLVALLAASIAALSEDDRAQLLPILSELVQSKTITANNNDYD